MKRMHTLALPLPTPAKMFLAPGSSPLQAARRLLAWGFGLLLGLLLALPSTAVRAEEDPPGRVGRLADLNGSVSWWDADAGAWAEAERNRPLTTGDRLSTARDGRAELRVGSTVLRVGNSTEVEVLRLDDEKLVFQLHSGSLALRVRTRELAEEIDIITSEARLRPQRAGHYRFDREDDTSHAASWRGELRGDDGSARGVPLIIGAGQRVELYRDGRRNGEGPLRVRFVELPEDGFSIWAGGEDAREERSATARYVSPEMTGAEDLDRHGRWEQHPDYGALWLPLVVRADWAPYRHGRWAWVRPWGWTWIDEAPWGFAPFHYGRWVKWRGRWGWVPGAYVQRPVYAPALVGWVGGSGWGVSVQIGGPTVGWVPLAPREVYRPPHRHTPRYVERVNPTPPYRWRHPPQHVPTGPISYDNQGVPRGVTVVSSDVLVRRQPVARGVIELPPGAPRQPLTVLPAPPAPAGVGPQAPRREPPPRWGGREVVRETEAPVQVVPGGAQPWPRPEPRNFSDDGREGFRPQPERGERERPERPPERMPERAPRSGPVYTPPQPSVMPTPRPEMADAPVQVVPAPQRAPQSERIGPQRPVPPAERAQMPERAQVPERARQPERAQPPERAPAPERAQVPGRERLNDRERERQSQR